MNRRKSGYRVPHSVGGLVGAIFVSASGLHGQIRVVDVIPQNMSGETDQNAESSLGAVQSLLQNEMILSSFADPLSTNHPYFTTTNFGDLWSACNFAPHADTSVAWGQSKAYRVRLVNANDPTDLSVPPTAIVVEASTAPQCGSPQYVAFSELAGSRYKPGAVPDQPSMALLYTPPSTNKDQIYIGFNDTTKGKIVRNFFTNATSASVHFSLDGGLTWNNSPSSTNKPPIVIEQKTNGVVQDSPCVRVAVAQDGTNIYAAFLRYESRSRPAKGSDYQGSVVVVKDTNKGLGGFKALGNSGAGSLVDFGLTLPNTDGGPRLGRERLGSDLAIAVDPKNAQKVYVAYVAIVAGEPLLRVRTSVNGGVGFSFTVFEPQATNNGVLGPVPAALPALAVANNGTVGLLYTRFYLNRLETRFAQAPGGDFTKVKEATLSSFLNGYLPPADTNGLYIGDFQSLQAGFQGGAVANAFFGAFSAANEPDARNFPSGVYYQRNIRIGTTTGTVVTNYFRLEGVGRLMSNSPTPQMIPDTANNPAGMSIDPFFFNVVAADPPPKVQVDKAQSGLEMHWPATEPRFNLESAFNVTDSSWTPLTNGVSLTNGEYSFLVNPTEARSFYRLRQGGSTNAQQVLWSAAGANGSVSPVGSNIVATGQNQTFLAIPTNGYVVDAWYLDGETTQQGGSSLTLTNFQAPHTVLVTFIPPNNLTLTQVGSPAPAAVGSNLTYTITVVNTGKNPLTGVVVTDALPSSVSFVSAISSQGTCSNAPGVVACNLGTLAPGFVASITITVIPGLEGTIANTASASANEPQLDLTYNTSTELDAVFVPPSITTQPQSQTVSAGGTATFSVAAAGTAPLNYQWYFNTAFLPDAATSTLTLTNVAPGQAGTYNVLISNDAGETLSDDATLTVQ